MDGREGGKGEEEMRKGMERSWKLRVAMVGAQAELR